MREINPGLLKPGAFAYHCKLFNVYPVGQSWDKSTMILMAQIITG